MPEKLSIEDFYSEGKKTGKLQGLLCDAGHITVPPRHSCRTCGSSNLEVVKLSGKGKISSFTEVYSKSKEFPLETPYTLVLTNLNEGPNLLGIIDQTESRKIEIGMRVKVRFGNLTENPNEWPRIFFDIETP